MRIVGLVIGFLALCAGPVEAQFSGVTWTGGAANIPAPDFSPCDFNVPTTFNHVWYIDNGPAGDTQVHYTAAGISLDPTVSPHQGDAAHPWNSLLAVFQGDTTNYPRALLSTATNFVSGNSSSPIKPGDEVLVMTGSGTYGVISAATSANSSFVVIKAAPGQTPLLTNFSANGDHLAFDGLKVKHYGHVGSLISSTGHNIVFNNMTVSTAEYADTSTWALSDWYAATNYATGNQTGISIGVGAKCAAILNSHVYITFGGISTYQASYVRLYNNEVDHFTADGVDLASQFTDLNTFYVHDPVLIGGAHTDFVQEVCAPACQPYVSHDVWIHNGLMLYQVDPALPYFGPSYASVTGCIDQTDGAWANVFITDNVCFIGGSPVPWPSGAYSIGGCDDCVWSHNVSDSFLNVNLANVISRGNLYLSTNVTVSNNIVAGSQCTDTNVNMKNNTFIYNGGSFKLCYGGIQTSYGGTPGVSLPGGNFIDTGISSEFVNIDYPSLIYDFHLKAGAPAIGAGTTALPRPLTDFYGRPMSNPPDNGAAAYP